MPTEPFILAGLGAAVLAVAWLPLLLRPLPLSLPMLAVAAGAGLAAALGATNFTFAHREAAERLTEFGLVVAVMGAGLKIDRLFGWRRWASVWRLLGVAMPLSILGIALLAWALLGLPVGEAVLLGGHPGADRPGAGLGGAGRAPRQRRGGRGPLRAHGRGRAQ